MNKIHSQKPIKYKYIVTLLALLLILTAGLIAINRNQSLKPETGDIKIETKNDTAQTTNKASNSSITSDKIAPTNSMTGDASLVAPFGALVSNHKPGQNGSNLVMSSQCITTAGATCRIEFKQDGIIRKLPDQKIDATGMTYWQWKVDDTGLTKGDWEIKAVASKNGQTKTTTDKILMEVK